MLQTTKQKHVFLNVHQMFTIMLICKKLYAFLSVHPTSMDLTLHFNARLSAKMPVVPLTALSQILSLISVFKYVQPLLQLFSEKMTPTPVLKLSTAQLWPGLKSQCTTDNADQSVLLPIPMPWEMLRCTLTIQQKPVLKSALLTATLISHQDKVFVYLSVRHWTMELFNLLTTQLKHAWRSVPQEMAHLVIMPQSVALAHVLLVHMLKKFPSDTVLQNVQQAPGVKISKEPALLHLWCVQQ